MKRHKVKLRYKNRVEKRERSRKILFRFTAALFILAVLGVSVNWASRFFLASPFFKVKSVEICGASIVDKEEIGAYLDFKGKNIFSLKLDKVEKQLAEKYPAIESIKINRIYPSRITAVITERQPIAEIKMTDRRVGIDRAMKAFVIPTDYKVMPYIPENQEKEVISACLNFLSAVYELSLYKDVFSVSADSPNDIIVFLNDGTKVCFGESANCEYKVSYLEKVRADLRAKGKEALYINMRDFSEDNKELVVRHKKDVKDIKEKNKNKKA